jgi:hypothetical protein
MPPLSANKDDGDDDNDNDDYDDDDDDDNNNNNNVFETHVQLLLINSDTKSQFRHSEYNDGTHPTKSRLALGSCQAPTQWVGGISTKE